VLFDLCSFAIIAAFSAGIIGVLRAFRSWEVRPVLWAAISLLCNVGVIALLLWTIRQ
jgi:hypothetical protein